MDRPMYRMNGILITHTVSILKEKKQEHFLKKKKSTKFVWASVMIIHAYLQPHCDNSDWRLY